jgi:hypothetical protein
LGDHQRAKREYTEGIALADAIGETRVGLLMKGYNAALQAEQGAKAGSDTAQGQRLLDAALECARQNYDESEASGLFYMRFESRRCLAIVYARRGELDAAEKICFSAAELIGPTESRISQLWLGPVYLDVLLANAERLEKTGRPDLAAAKLDYAREYLNDYQELVSKCQSPRFTREAEHFAEKLGRANAEGVR